VASPHLSLPAGRIATTAGWRDRGRAEIAGDLRRSRRPGAWPRASRIRPRDGGRAGPRGLRDAALAGAAARGAAHGRRSTGWADGIGGAGPAPGLGRIGRPGSRPRSSAAASSMAPGPWAYPRARAAWRCLGVDGLGIADEVPGPAFSAAAMPRLTVRMVARLQGFPGFLGVPRPQDGGLPAGRQRLPAAGSQGPGRGRRPRAASPHPEPEVSDAGHHASLTRAR
jgi:hypothetical protein